MQPSSPQRETVERLAEEFVERYRRGERPPLTEYTERYPEHAEQIRDLFPALVLMEQIAPDSDSPAASGGTSLERPIGEHPKQIGDYRILREIGRGGMGIVYEAEQVSLGRHVALKVLPQQLLPNSTQRQRFEREARSAAKLHHTNIVPVFGVGEDSGLHYYVMQYIQGLGLDAVLDELRRLRREKGPGGSTPAAEELRVARDGGQDSNRRPKDGSAEEVAVSLLTGVFERPGGLAPQDMVAEGADSSAASATGGAAPLETAAVSVSSVVLPGQSDAGRTSKGETYWHSVAHVGVQVAGALAYAHQQGILHRDIKPANLLLDTQGTVWVTDFGLAKVEDQQNLTLTGDVVGTLRYMAPEVFNGKADARSEVYALGLTLYEMVALKPAFDEQDRNQLVKQVTTAEPPRLDKINRAIPRDLVTIVHKAIDREPAKRYQTAQELADDLRRFLGGEPVRARPARIWERGVKWARRRPAVAALVAVSAVAVLSLLGGSLWHNTQLGGALQTSEERRIDANTHLYHSLIGEVRALRLARVVGYRRQAWDRLQQALRLETPAKDKEQLRQEAAACLGDFVGLEPTTWTDFPTGISCAALHPDGTQLAVGLVDGTVLLRRIPTGAPIAKLTEHRSAVSSLAFRTDGKELVSTDRAGKIKVWQSNDTATWTCRKTIAIEPALFFLTPSLVFPFFTPTFTERSIDWAILTPDGRNLAVPFPKESTIILVDLADGTTAARFRAPRDEKIRCMAFSPDGKLLAVGYAHKGTSGVLVWDVATRGLKKSLLPELGHTTGVRFSPDGKLLACVHHQGIALYDTSTFQHRQFVREIVGTSFGPSDFDKTADQDRLLGHGDMPAFIAFSPDSQVIAIYAFQLGLIRLWNVFTNREVASLSWPGRLGLFMTVMEFSKDGKTFVAARERSLRTWNLAGASEKLVLEGHAGGVPDVVFSPDGKRLVSAGKDHKIKIWDPVTGTLLNTLKEFSTPVQTLCFTPDGRVMAAGDYEKGAVRFYDVESWKELAVMPAQVGPMVLSIAFSPAGEYFAAGGSKGLRLWRVVRGKAEQPAGTRLSLQRLGRLANTLSSSVCFSADGKWLAWAGWHEADHEIINHVHLWDLRRSQAHTLSTARTEFYVLALAFYPDSKHLAFVSDKKAIAVWDANTKQEAYSFGEGELERRGALLPHTRLSADGAWYVVAGRAATVWDMAAKKLLVALPEERGAIWSVAWSPNGERLAVGTADGDLVIWNLPKVNAKLAEIGLNW
jgi:WD40 repeat protein/serine/threonine protein kinase